MFQLSWYSHKVDDLEGVNETQKQEKSEPQNAKSEPKMRASLSVINRTTRTAARSKMTFAPFDYTDPLRLASCFTDEEKMVFSTAQAYAQEKLQPRIVQANRHEKFDREIMTEMGELGLLVSKYSVARWGCCNFWFCFPVSTW